jgi:hypothetical protein
MAVRYDQLVRFPGLLIFVLYSGWIVVGLTLSFPYWLTFAGPVPVLLAIYLLWFIVRHRKNPEQFSKEAKIKEIEADYQDAKL